MKAIPEALSPLSLHARAMLAMKEAVANVIAEHKRLNLPLAIWRGGKVVWISAAEAEAELAASSAPVPRP